MYCTTRTTIVIVYKVYATHLEAGDVVQPRELFDIARLCVEASSVPRTADTTVTKETFDQGSSVVGALVTDGGKLSVLTHQQSLGVTNVYLLHPAETRTCN